MGGLYTWGGIFFRDSGGTGEGGVIMSGMKAVSLFSGAGGMDIGVDRAGFHTVCAVEIDRHCVDTLAANQSADKPKEIVHADIREVNPAALMRKLGLRAGEVSLLHGGPPCQPFSVIGKREGMQDERGPLLFELIRFARVFRPGAVMLEQVPGVWKAEGGEVMRRFESGLAALGYTMFTHGVVNAADFGVPQSRRRFIQIALRGNVRIVAFSGNINRHRTVGEAIQDLGRPALSVEKAGTPNHVDVTPARDRERISFVPEGSWLGRQDSAPESVRRNLTRKDSTKFRRMARDLPANTLRCGEIFYHPTAKRYLTPREYMRLHGFPDDYTLRGPIRGRRGRVPNLDQHRQVANSVPPPLAEGLARQIRESLCHQ